jgi:hypothetical protein
MSSRTIALYESLKQLNESQFGELCLRLKDYGYQLNFVTLQGVPIATSAKELIDFVKQYPQGFTHLAEVIDKVAPQQKVNAFPHLLYYLPDRKPQKEALKKAIKDYRAQYADKKQRPLLCLIHGNENEYGNFIKCLLEEVLVNDKALSDYFRNGRFEIELLLEEFHTVDALHQEILAFLETKINAKPEKEAIANKLAKERRPIILHVRLFSQDFSKWQDEHKTVIDGFIDFWADWPKKIYAQHQLFLVLLSFSYEKEKNPFSLLNWFRRKRTHLTLMKQFETLNQKYPTIMAFFENQHVHGKVLPKLESVKKNDAACKWISTYEEQIKPFWPDTYALELKIKTLYEKRDAIPMDELACQLEQLLTNPNQ